MKKRILSLLLALALVAGLLPGTVLAGETDEITVYVTIYNQGEFVRDRENGIMLKRAVAVTDLNRDGSYSLDEALSAAHSCYYESGAEGYAIGVGNYGYSVFKLWGIETFSLGFFRNNVSTTTVDEENLAPGDDITAFIYKDQTNWSDRYAFFTESSKTVCVNDAFEVELKGFSYDSFGNLIEVPIVGAPLGVYDENGTYGTPDSIKGEFLGNFGGTDFYKTASTDTDGKATITFTETGTYILTAKHDASEYGTYDDSGFAYPNYLVPPICTVTVLSEEAYTSYTVLNPAMEALTWASMSSEDVNAVTTAPTLPSSLDIGGETVTVDWSVTDPNYTNALSVGNYGYGWSAYVDRPASADAACTLTATLTYREQSVTKDFRVTVKAEGVVAGKESVIKFKTLMDTIAGTYTSSTDAWTILDMAAYGKNVKGDSYGYSSAAASALAEAAVKGTNGSYLDSLKSFDANGAYAIYTTPYVLLAYDAAGLDDTGLANTRESMKAAMVAYLSAIETNYAGVDEVAPVLSALAPYYHQGDAALDAAVDGAIAWLSAQQCADGTFAYYGTSNANSTALAIVALTACGIDAHTDARFIKNYSSAVDGLMHFALASLDGFGYKGNVTKNPLATEQGFRALVAYARFKETATAYNIYVDADVSAPAPADPGISGTVPPAPVEPTGTVTAFFTLIGDGVHGEGTHTAYETWIDRRSVTVTSGSSVGDVFRTALAAEGYAAIGADRGYVSGIVTPNGVTLSQYDNGVNSGWMYRVNGVLPSVGMNDYVVSNRDEIIWFYADDWNTVYSAEESSGDVTPTAPVFTDTGAHWAAQAIETVCALGLMDGVEETAFVPESASARSTLVTALYRLSGATGGDPVDWAVQNGILTGYGDGVYGTEDPMTREQLAVFLYRYARMTGKDTADGRDLGAFLDGSTVSPWAADAMAWAVAEGLICGTAADTLAPQETATRAQTAVILARWLEKA